MGTVLRTKRISELEAALSQQEEVVAQAVATFRALEAELASLKAGVAQRETAIYFHLGGLNLYPQTH